MDAAHSVAAVDSGRENSPEGETVWRPTENSLQIGLLWLWRYRELIMSKLRLHTRTPTNVEGQFQGCPGPGRVGLHQETIAHLVSGPGLAGPGTKHCISVQF